MVDAQLLFYGYVITFLAVWLAAGYWIYSDATSRGLKMPIIWGIASVLFFPIGIYYLYSYPLSTTTNSKPSAGRDALKIVVISGFLGFVISGAVSPPDFITQWFYWIMMFALIFPIVFWADRSGKRLVSS